MSDLVRGIIHERSRTRHDSMSIEVLVLVDSISIKVLRSASIPFG